MQLTNKKNTAAVQRDDRTSHSKMNYLKFKSQTKVLGLLIVVDPDRYRSHFQIIGFGLVE